MVLCVCCAYDRWPVCTKLIPGLLEVYGLSANFEPYNFVAQIVSFL